MREYIDPSRSVYLLETLRPSLASVHALPRARPAAHNHNDRVPTLPRPSRAAAGPDERTEGSNRQKMAVPLGFLALVLALCTILADRVKTLRGKKDRDFEAYSRPDISKMWIFVVRAYDQIKSSFRAVCLTFARTSNPVRCVRFKSYCGFEIEELRFSLAAEEKPRQGTSDSRTIGSLSNMSAISFRKSD
jgi:hypothetical protein